MTQDEIIEMARQTNLFGIYADEAIDSVTRFANLVAQHERERIKQANAPEIERVNAHIKELEDAVLAEREACAKLFDERDKDIGWYDPGEPAEIIRARGQA
jgi:hypothetical protein